MDNQLLFNTENRDKLFLASILVGAALLFILGPRSIQSSVILKWGYAFGSTAIVVVLGTALYRLQMELQQSRLELARKEAEINFAKEVHQALFPKHLPTISGMEFSAVCIPARGISGDYYDVMQLPDGRLIFAIADISGKGISAAILVANLQAVLRVLAENCDSPAQLCARINHHLHHVTDSARFATFFYAEWDQRKRQLRYVNAGHHSPILVGSKQGKKLQEGGLPLGIMPGYDFQVGEIDLETEDLLVLYSDGITEARSKQEEDFGEERLAKLVETNKEKSPREIQELILEAIRQWSGEDQEDDMTLLIVKATR
ncbi:MAG: PP2C family protein-serine/threonine phosphatase [Blastocatellia bacterium]|nr:PP2C family protein-serine/threonine phosphatase [Blastocatellia bacterium]